jgi:N-acyl homoserine lactone hydrolase
VHLQYSWNFRIAPSFNFNLPQSMATIDAMKEFAAQNKAALWINHDMEQMARVPKAPQAVR